MPEWKPRIRAAFIAVHHPLDEDIVEELAQHAEASYEASRAEALVSASRSTLAG